MKVPGIIRRLWRSDHYDWLSGYLAAQRMIRIARVALIVVGVSFTACLFVLLASGDGPREPVPVAMVWIAAGGGLAGAVLFGFRWPSRTQSLAFVAVANASVALACLAQPSPMAALMGCIAFATSGGYVALFHSTGWGIYNFGVATLVTTVLAVRLAMTGHPALAGVGWWVVVEVNIALPLATQILTRSLAGDLLRADTDPLTGLLNRRAFQREVMAVMRTCSGNADYLMVILVDLDKFKALNDRYGHRAGDQALVHTAHVLSATAGARAVIGRIGGEEFVLATISATCTAESLATQLCDAIAASRARVTASIGAACTPLDGLPSESCGGLLEELIATADEAMYLAKRRGGNQIHHPADSNHPS
ncbi:diguanylate cyclase (plasmid) [Mycolicibacterium psychrotolerans]|uniref:GGDEF domain-containing protein n=1 Tax=Mycolicibacterium psychrotolerans TaxID=216929 RepID=UPI003D6742B3